MRSISHGTKYTEPKLSNQPVPSTPHMCANCTAYIVVLMYIIIGGTNVIIVCTRTQKCSLYIHIMYEREMYTDTKQLQFPHHWSTEIILLVFLSLRTRKTFYVYHRPTLTHHQYSSIAMCTEREAMT